MTEDFTISHIVILIKLSVQLIKAGKVKTKFLFMIHSESKIILKLRVLIVLPWFRPSEAILDWFVRFISPGIEDWWFYLVNTMVFLALKYEKSDSKIYSTVTTTNILYVY